MKKIFILFFFFSLLCGADVKNELKQVYLITIDDVDEYWVDVYKGANDALSENGKNILLSWIAPNNKNDTEQLELLKTAIASKASAIILSVNDPLFLNETIKEASQKGVKFIFIDSSANLIADQVIQTNNYAAGKAAAKEMLKHLKAKEITNANVGIISVNPYTQSLNEREKGFRDTMKNEDFNVFTTRYSDGKPFRAQKECQMLLKLGAVGVFSTNEGTSKGVSTAIKEAKKSIVAIGFDFPKNLEELIKDDVFSSAIRQNPYQMGYESMKSAIKLLNNEPLNSRFVDTGIDIISK